MSISFEAFGEQSRIGPLTDQARALWKSMPGETRFGNVLGWLDCNQATEGHLRDVLLKAEQWRSMADTLVVVGVGGSNQAARGVIDALQPKGMRVIWAGNTLSAYELRRTLDSLEGHSVVMQVIAKNFETLEPGSHYRVLRNWMKEHYPQREIADRVVLTGTEGSRLHEIARENGHLFLPFPVPVGGRYTAFTVVGLLPVATAGLDAEAYLRGGLDAQRDISVQDGHPAFAYAAWRNAQRERGFQVEMLTGFEPRLERFGRWWRQLFGESEGKQRRGLYPACAVYSEDLHSIGQYVQEGARLLIETFLSVRDDGARVPVPEDRGARDGFDYLENKDFTFINRAAEKATIEAHTAGGIPCARLTADRCDEYNIGQLYYTMMAACSVSAQILGVNPFDQEGVEAYKRSMFAALGKP